MQELRLKVGNKVWLKGSASCQPETVWIKPDPTTTRWLRPSWEPAARVFIATEIFFIFFDYFHELQTNTFAGTKSRAEGWFSEPFPPIKLFASGQLGSLFWISHYSQHRTAIRHAEEPFPTSQKNLNWNKRQISKLKITRCYQEILFTILANNMKKNMHC